MSEIYCCGCGVNVEAFLTNGAAIYPNRNDLSSIPFWKCSGCGNFVGCHHKTKNRTRPLGCIPTNEIRFARKEIHKILDPIWKSKAINRSQLYKKISDFIGKEYHTAEIKSIEEARQVYRVILNIKKSILNKVEKL